MNEKPWLLKVLNGPNAGAQILVSKEITVGTSLECDLILNDPHIAALHCQIKKSAEEGFEITPRDGVIFINGTQVKEDGAVLKLGEVLTLGSTHLTGGPSEQLWPPVTIPEIKEIGSTPPESAAVASLDASGTVPPAAKKKTQLLSKISLAILILVGSCMLVGLALFKLVAHKNLMIPRSTFQPVSFDKEDEKILQTKRSLAETTAKELQKKFPKNNIKVVESNGTCVLYIYVRDQLQGDYVRKIMNENTTPVICNIINISDIDDSALAMMEAMNLAVTISVDKDTGKVLWHGYLPNEELLDSVKKQIARDIPAITDQEFHIILGGVAIKQVRDILAKNYFGNITPTPERENISLTGTIGFADSMRWEKTLQELEAAFQNNVKFLNMVTISAAAMKGRGLFNAPIVSISISSSPYAILQNGERIFLGARANNGYIVSSITRKGIGLINHGDKKMVPLVGASTSLENNTCK